MIEMQLPSGHPGVRRTIYFVIWDAPSISKDVVKGVVRKCTECKSVDPAPIRWQSGTLEVRGIMLGMDITHYGQKQYLILVDY